MIIITKCHLETLLTVIFIQGINLKSVMFLGCHLMLLISEYILEYVMSNEKVFLRCHMMLLLILINLTSSYVELYS